MSLSEDELLKLAEAELLREAKRAEIRYSTAGPSGWNPCPLHKTNKRFLINTLKQTIDSNRLRQRSPIKSVKERKFFKGRNSHGYCNDNIVFKKREVSQKNDKERKKARRNIVVISDDDDDIDEKSTGSDKEEKQSELSGSEKSNERVKFNNIV